MLGVRAGRRARWGRDPEPSGSFTSSRLNPAHTAGQDPSINTEVEMDDLINSLCVQQRLVLKDVQSKPAWTSNAWRGGEAIKLNYFSPS